MIEQLFEPKSVAIVGVSLKDDTKWGNQILRNLTTNGFVGNILPINPGGGSIGGLVVYKSILDAPLPIDQVVICVPSVFVAEVLGDCGKAGIEAVIIISAGFSELGNHDLEKELIYIAEMYNISMVGPNTFGLQSRSGKLNVSLIGEL